MVYETVAYENLAIASGSLAIATPGGYLGRPKNKT
jgi:hypothetical protein